MKQLPTIVCSLALLGSACDKDQQNVGETNGSDTPSTAAQNPDPAAKPEPDKAEKSTAAAEAGWSIDLHGVDIPNLSGEEVVFNEAENKYLFKGAPAMFQLALNEPPPETGEVTPKSVSLTYTGNRMNCGFVPEAESANMKVTYAKSGEVRNASFDGVLSCSAIGPQGEQILARVSGSFVHN